MSERLPTRNPNNPTVFERIRGANTELFLGTVALVLIAGCSKPEAQVFRSTGDIVGQLVEYDEEAGHFRAFWTDESGLQHDNLPGSFPSAVYSASTEEGEEFLVGCMGAQDYVVQPGDTLHSISEEQVGLYWADIVQPTPYKESLVNIIADINEIADPDYIQAGEPIVVPRICDTERANVVQGALESMQQ